MTKNEIQAVRIVTSEINLASQIMRAGLAGENACIKLGKFDQAKKFHQLRKWAEDYHDILGVEMQVSLNTETE